MGSGDTIGGLPKYKVNPGMFCLQPRSSIKFLMIAILMVKIQETIGVTVGNGNVFTGEVRNRKPIGNGTFTKANREKYTGYFTDGKMSGMFVVEYADGHVYRGDVDEDATREGKGVYTWPSGNKYDGEWRNGKRNGLGIFTWGPESKWAGDRYEGEWRNNSMSGHGIYYYSSGNKYDGKFNQGKKNGWGTYIYKNYCTKNIKLKHKKERKLAVYFALLAVKIFTCTYPHILNVDIFTKYDGEWINDNKTGYGKMLYKDERIYNGQWNSEQKREGDGLLLWPNGTCFFGQMKNNKIYHGLSMTPDLIFSFPPYKNATFNNKGFKVINFTTGEIECFREDKSKSCYNKPNSVDNMYFSGPDHYYVGDTITVRRRKIMDGFGEFGIDGGFYIGEMKQGIQTGFGLKSEPFLPTLIGTFEDGKLEGMGASISYSAKHRVVYFGGYKMGKPDGPGIFIYPDGEKVIGYFNKGKLDHTKKPIYIHADGTRDSLVTVNP